MMLLEILFYSFIIVVFLQALIYFFIYGRFAFLKPTESKTLNERVSVLVCAKNEAENLKSFLPSILNQNYPNFELVLINDSSNDDTLEIMESFAHKHPNIKIVDVKEVEAFWGNKKYALTLGIKAAKNEYLLLTDADCKPLSTNWIREMTSHFTDKKSIVLGYGAHTKVKNSLINKFIRFETVLTAIRYFSFTKVGMPYMGVGRNLAYRKSDFFAANGYMNHMRIKSGDDDLFINQIATAENTAICFHTDGMTTSASKKTYADWVKQKRRHISTASYYKPKHKVILATIYLVQFLFWALASTLLISSYKLIIVASLISVQLILQYIIIGTASKKLGSKDIIYLIPFLEIFLIFSQLYIFIKNQNSKNIPWK